MQPRIECQSSHPESGICRKYPGLKSSFRVPETAHPQDTSAISAIRMLGCTENHVDTADPVVIEGGAILPSLLSRPTVQTRTSHGQIQAVFLVEPEEDALLAHMDVRYRIRVRYNATELRAMAHVRWLHGRWLAEEARRYELPVHFCLTWHRWSQTRCSRLSLPRCPIRSRPRPASHEYDPAHRHPAPGAMAG